MAHRFLVDHCLIPTRRGWDQMDGLPLLEQYALAREQ